MPTATSAAYPPSRSGDFYIAVEWDDYVMSFTCYECVGELLESVVDGTPSAVRFSYNRRDYDSLPDPVEDIAEAQPFVTGRIDWQGCMNVRFDEQGEILLHFCGRDDAARVGRLFDRLFDLAEKHILKWEG